jgi:hypothetical protein
MSKIRFALAGLFSLFVVASAAAQPVTMPTNSVWGRLGIGPGPGNAIPFARFQSAISGPCSTTTSGLVPATGGGTANFLRSDCTFATPTPSASNNQLLANISGSTGAAAGTNPTSLWDSFCSSGVGQFWVRMSSAWGCTALGYANPVWFGADPTGTNDSATAWNSANATGLPVRFPPGSFKLNSNIAKTLGAGIQSYILTCAGRDLTKLFWPTGNGLTVNYGGVNSSVHINGCTFTTGTTNAGPAITLSSTTSTAVPGFNAQNDIENVTCRGNDGYFATDYWINCLSLANVSNTNVTGLVVAGPSTQLGTGISIVGDVAASTYAVVLNIDKSYFTDVGVGLLYQSFVQGVAISNSNFTGCTACIDVPASQTGVL